MVQPRVISVIPHLMQGEGHIVPYHGAVREAVLRLGWTYRAWIPPGDEALAQELTPEGVLLPVDLEAEGGLGDKLGRIPEALGWGKMLAAALASEITSETPVILFMERFIHLHLLGLWWGLRSLNPKIRPSLYLWILYRRDVQRDQTRKLYRWLHRRIVQTLPPGHCQCLTDSDRLGQSLQQFFQEPFTVLPIPHTDFPAMNPLPLTPDPVVVWWPGSPREEKGWSVIRALTQRSWTGDQQIQLVAAQAAQLSQADQGVAVVLIGDRLSREEYSEWLNRAQGILLPYDAVAYQERTSGIFTETIMAGRMPFVTAGTWMAAELERYDLTALILDWEDLDLWRSVVNCLNNRALRQTLARMQSEYRQFHTLDHYAQLLASLNPQFS